MFVSRPFTELTRLSVDLDIFVLFAAGFFGRLGFEAAQFRGESWQPSLEVAHVRSFLNWLDQERNDRTDEKILKLFFGGKDEELCSKMTWPAEKKSGQSYGHFICT